MPLDDLRESVEAATGVAAEAQALSVGGASLDADGDALIADLGQPSREGGSVA
eukprot:gene7763-11109_t